MSNLMPDALGVVVAIQENAEVYARLWAWLNLRQLLVMMTTAVEGREQDNGAYFLDVHRKPSGEPKKDRQPNRGDDVPFISAPGCDIYQEVMTAR